MRNTTLPVGTGAPGSTAATVADNVTGSPATLNDGTTLSTVVDDAALTVATTGADVDASTVADPLNVAVNEGAPIGSFTVVNDATEPTTDTVPNDVDPALNTTDPVTGDDEVTVAVNVTD